MIIRKDNGKKLLELNEKEFIIYGFFKDKHIDRKDILSAGVFNYNMLTILYKGNYNFCKNITNMKFSDREGLNAILNELNKEELIFFPNSYSIDPLINTTEAFCFKKGKTKIKMPLPEFMDYPIKYKQILKEITLK